MAETSNIAKMAVLHAQELFSEFLWEQIGPTDYNWKCENPEQHNKRLTHPTDIVFFYDEPYSLERTYVNCDLKSYAANSITPGSIRNALESLCMAVSCAEKSEDWQKQYTNPLFTSSISGLLFIYNHDGDYDENFKGRLETIDEEKLDIPPSSKVVILGPPEIFWLHNVSCEIIRLRGITGPDRLPDREFCSFHYPQLEQETNWRPRNARAANLEMMTGPWIFFKYVIDTKSDKEGLIVFYRGKGESADEFIYLLDSLRHFGCFERFSPIEIKTLDTVKDAAVAFQQAQFRYTEQTRDSSATNSSELALLIRGIKYSRMNRVVKQYSDVEIGMNYD